MRARDLRGVLELAHALSEPDDLPALRAVALAELDKLVASDVRSWNELWLDAGRANINAVEPADAIDEGAEEKFAAVAHQNPLVAANLRPGMVRKFSDYLTLRQLHRLDIYDVAYRPRGLEHQVAWTLPAPAGQIIGIALSRVRRDFSERDRGVLEVAAPVIAAAHRRVLTAAVLRGILATLQQADGESRAVIILRRDGSVEHVTPGAQRLLARFGPPVVPGGLPEPLSGWLATQRSARTARRPLQTAGWTARYTTGDEGASFEAILLESVDGFDPWILERAGIARRERQVLALVAVGASNIQIARRLDISERTVAKHLQHVYVKFGVNNRTAAVARARGATAGASVE